jgi:hypothetical protein
MQQQQQHQLTGGPANRSIAQSGQGRPNNIPANAHREDALRKALATQNAIAIARSRMSSAPNDAARTSLNPSLVNNHRPQQAERPSASSQHRGPSDPGAIERALRDQRRQEKDSIRQRLPSRDSAFQQNAAVASVGGETANRRSSVSSAGSSPAEQYLRMHYATSLLAGGANEVPNAAKQEGNKVAPVRQPRDNQVPAGLAEMTENLMRSESAMSTLVRKLLGHAPVDGDECPLVLDGGLISALSDKIRLVVHKLVDIQVDSPKAKKRSAAEMDPHHVIDLSMEDDGESGPPEKRWKSLAMTASKLLEGEKAKVARLTQELAEKDDLLSDQAKEAAYVQNYCKAEETSAAMKNLVGQLDEGMKTVQRQKQEILSLRTVINQDAADLQERDRTIADLRQQLTRNETNPTVVPQDTQNELLELREEVKTMTETLKRERRMAESNARSYMRAAVHAVKIHNRHTDKNNEKRE